MPTVFGIFFIFYIFHIQRVALKSELVLLFYKHAYVTTKYQVSQERVSLFDWTKQKTRTVSAFK